jgi:hypothetical protein
VSYPRGVTGCQEQPHLPRTRIFVVSNLAPDVQSVVCSLSLYVCWWNTHLVIKAVRLVLPYKRTVWYNRCGVTHFLPVHTVKFVQQCFVTLTTSFRSNQFIYSIWGRLCITQHLCQCSLRPDKNMFTFCMNRVFCRPTTFSFRRRLRKIAKRNYQLLHVLPSIRMEKQGSHWVDFYEIFYSGIFFENLARKFKFH